MSDYRDYNNDDGWNLTPADGFPGMTGHGDPDPRRRVADFFERGDVEGAMRYINSIINLPALMEQGNDAIAQFINVFGIPLSVEDFSGQYNTYFGEQQDATLDPTTITNENNQNGNNQNENNQDGNNQDGNDQDVTTTNNTGEMTGEINADFSSRNKWGDAAPLGSYTPDTWFNTGKFLVKRADGSLGIVDTEAEAQTQTGADSPFTSLSNQLPTGDDNQDAGNEDINQQVLDDLLVRNADGTLNLSVVGILGAVFGGELGNQSREDLAEVLDLFGLTLDDYDEEIGNEQEDQTGNEQNNEQNNEQANQSGNEQNNQSGNDNGNVNQGNNGNVNQGNTNTSQGNTETEDGEVDRRDDEEESGGFDVSELIETILAAIFGSGIISEMPGGGTGIGVGTGTGGAADADADATATGGSATAEGGSATAQGGAGGQGGQGGAGGQGGIGQGGAGGIGQGGVGEGGEATIGDTLQTIGDTIINNILPDADSGTSLAEALAAQAASDYYTDALRDASEDELAFLRELMGRQDTFEIFRNLGLPLEEGDQRLDYELNKIRRLVDRELEDRYMIEPEVDILPLIQEVDAVDPSGLNQINVADLLLGMDVGMAPGAIDTPVNQIDPFNPEDPALRFLQDEGRRAIEASAAAQGRLNSGGTLAELQDQAIGIAATRAGELADIGRVQDASQLAADQQFYSQLLGSGQEDFGRGIERLSAISDAQRLQDQLALEADARRFETEQADLGQRFDQSRFANLDAQGREDTLFNQLGSLIDIGYGGAQGLTGNMSTFSGLGGGIYQDLGDASAYQALQRGDNTRNFLGNLFGRGGI